MKKRLYPELPVMLVDDEDHILLAFETELKGAGITNTVTCNDSREVVSLVSRQEIGVMLLDLSMPYISGEELLEAMAQEYPDVSVIVVTGIDETETAVRCMKAGAIDYLVKPVEEGLLAACVKRAVQFRELNDEVSSLRERLFSENLERPDAFSAIITDCSSMMAIFRYVEAVAKTSNPILITGETGVGKELLARAIHQLSSRSGRLVPVNVSGLEDNVFSDTLFGHRKGAFTGAEETRQGMIERASGGSLFLDEIGDLSTASQIKLLRLLQEGEYLPLGSDLPGYSDARVIAATNHDLKHAQAEGRFRKDLYYRLKTHHIHLPPLRDRVGDLPLLLDHFLEKAARELTKEKPTTPNELLDVLGAYSFPGNVRELEAMIFDAVSVHRGGILSTRSFRNHVDELESVFEKSTTIPHQAPDNPFNDWLNLPTLKDADKLLMEAALKRANNNLTVAAQLLGISKQALGKRLKKFRHDNSPH